MSTGWVTQSMAYVSTARVKSGPSILHALSPLIVSVVFACFLFACLFFETGLTHRNAPVSASSAPLYQVSIGV